MIRLHPTEGTCRKKRPAPAGPQRHDSRLQPRSSVPSRLVEVTEKDGYMAISSVDAGLPSPTLMSNYLVDAFGYLKLFLASNRVVSPYSAQS